MSDGLVIIVDRDLFQVQVVDPGLPGDNPERVRSMRCAVGMTGFRTPVDEYKTGARTLTPDWRAPSWVEPPLEPGKIYEFGEPFNPYRHGLISLRALDAKGNPRTGYAIHGTTNEASIPGAASHGCIRLKEHHIKWLYDNIPDNTLVIIR